MKITKILSLTFILLLFMTLFACSNKSTQAIKSEVNSLAEATTTPVASESTLQKEESLSTEASPQTTGQIYLYGEEHGVKKILDKELELWCDYYNNQNMRHLFIEIPYFTAQFLNLWMQSDNDDIFNEIYEDWVGSSLYNLDSKEFYLKIKEKCPETIFHGTDVGHQYDTTGKRYLEYLEQNNMKDSEEYLIAKENMNQGMFYRENSDDVYRENKMVENFIRECNKVSSESIMGIYGSAHTYFDAMDLTTNSVPCMANQLKAVYGENIHSEDISWLAKDMDPLRVDTITIDGKDYEASYFGKQDLTGFKNFSHREFWRLENAYDDLKGKLKTGEVLPYYNYPMLIEVGQVFVVDITYTDGSTIRCYYRSDGNTWRDQPTTEGFTID